MPLPNRQIISISTGTFIRAALVLAIAWVAVMIRSVIAILLVSILFAAILNPIADFFEKRKIRRSITVIAVYLIVLAILAGLVLLVIPPLIDQTGQLVENFGVYWQKLVSSFETLQDISARYGLLDNLQRSLVALNSYISSIAIDFFGALGSVISTIISFFVVLVIAFFLVVERDGLKTSYRPLIPARHHDYVSSLINKIQGKVGAWLLGQLVLMLFVGALTYLGLIAFGIKYALILAVIAGVTEIVPYAGPVIALIPAVFFAAAQSPTKGIIVLILYFVIQRIENAILVPKIMQKATGLNPVLAILAVAIGFEVGGIAGALLSVPVATVANVIIADYIERQNKASA